MKGNRKAFKKKNQSHSPGFKSRATCRKQERKEKRKQKKSGKVGLAFNNNLKNIGNFNKENDKTKHYDKIKSIKAYANQEKEKILKRKQTIKGDSNSDQNESSDNSSFKSVESSSLKDRMARLQAFVNKEAKNTTIDSSSNNSKKLGKPVSKESINNNNATDALIKDKVKRKALLQDCKEDNREINKLAKLLGIRKSKKKKTVHPMFEEFDMNILLQDVDEHTLENSDYYQDNNGADNFENDFSIVEMKEEQKNIKYKMNKKRSLCDEEDDDENESEDEDDDIYESDMSVSEDNEDKPTVKSSNKVVKFNENIDVKIISKKLKYDPNTVIDTKTKTCSILKKPKSMENKSDYKSSNSEDDDMDDLENENEDQMDIDVDEKSEVKEDIYGRLVDGDGQVISSAEEPKLKGTKYVPPALRKLMQLDSNDENKKEKLRNLSRSLKGLLNRLAEENMAGICSQIETFFVNNSRNDMNDTLTELLFNSLVMPTLTPERLVQEHALMVSVLSANAGVEVGAHILAKFVDRWNEMMLDDNQDNKELDNIVLVIANLYNFKVVGSPLIYDILNKHIENFREKDIDIILHILRSVGFTLRKDDPLALKSLITSVQTKAAEYSQDNDESYSRVKFMMEILLAIRNNNMAKMPDYDPTHVEYLKKMLKGIIHKGKQCPDLKVTLKDLLDSHETGRWWLVGSAWSGGLIENQALPCQQVEVKPTIIKNPTKFSEKFKKYAAKLRLARPPRINILFAMTEGSHDVHDAFEKLLQLSLPQQHEKEIFDILLLCCIKGKLYNPFYAHLAEKFCGLNKKYVRLMLHSLWDKLSQISNLKSNSIANLSQFVSYLITEESINLSVFKTLSFLESGSVVISFVRQVLLTILLHPSGESVVCNIFSQLSTTPKLDILRQTLRIFILKFLKPDDSSSANYRLLSNRIKVATDCLEVAAVKL